MTYALIANRLQQRVNITLPLIIPGTNIRAGRSRYQIPLSLRYSRIPSRRALASHQPGCTYLLASQPLELHAQTSASIVHRAHADGVLVSKESDMKTSSKEWSKRMGKNRERDLNFARQVQAILTMANKLVHMARRHRASILLAWIRWDHRRDFQALFLDSQANRDRDLPWSPTSAKNILGS